MILAGDIGGTNTRLAFFIVEGSRLTSVFEETFPSRMHRGLDEIAKQFLSAHNLSPSIACFGIAGPVKNGRGETTNLPWLVDARFLTNELHIPTVLLINDLEATAYGVTILDPTEWVVLNAGVPDAVGNAAVIAAGTGLGEAGLYWNGQRYRPFATEGGHTDFAPRSQLESELLNFLLGRFEHVSYERVLSGPGLVNIYQFLLETGRGDEPAWLAEELRLNDPAAVITTMVDRDTIHYQVTIDDATVYTRPWTMAWALVRETDSRFQLLEEACVEGDRDLPHFLEAGRKFYFGKSWKSSVRRP